MSYQAAQDELAAIPERDRQAVRIQATEILNRIPGLRYSDAVTDAVSLYRAHGVAGLLTTDPHR
jgi:hypothetical protein